MIRVALVDAALDLVGDDDEDGTTATVLADLLDAHGEWDWSDGSAHCPSDRVAVVESSGAYWCVYRGVEPDRAWRCGTGFDAERQAALLIESAVSE